MPIMADDDSTEGIEGLEPVMLFRTVLGEPSGDPQVVQRAAEEERRIRAEIEQRLPDLEFLELLGRGGMGFVYRARQENLDREVAVKVVASEAERQDEFAKRFAREAQALARLNHPNLVTIHDYGQDGPLGWLVMEYVDGSSLRDLIRAGRLEPSEALTLIPKICDALQYAHDQGVVHRDVKPENILVSGEGGVKIADFGLAKLIGTPAALVSLTGSREVLGTFRYMAPEQLERPLDVDHRADIYSLGVVFYEMLTGEIPMGRFDPPSACSSATAEVDDVVLRALAREPDRRYQFASELKSHLESLNSDTRAPKADGGARLSIAAAVSAAVAGAGLLPFAISAAAFASGATDGDETGEAAAFMVGCLGFAMMAAGGVLGFRALRRIRGNWPRQYGAGAAVFGAWTAILIFLNGAVLGSLPLSDAAAGFLTLLLLGGEAYFLVRYRRRFLERCADTGSS